MKGKKLQPRILYRARLSFRFDGKIKSFPETAKVKSTQLHQTSFATNAEGTSLGRKHKRRKRPTKNKPQKIKKMVIVSYILIITVNINGLNDQPKDTDWLGGYKNKTHLYAVYKRPISDVGTFTY